MRTVVCARSVHAIYARGVGTCLHLPCPLYRRPVTLEECKACDFHESIKETRPRSDDPDLVPVKSISNTELEIERKYKVQPIEFHSNPNLLTITVDLRGVSDGDVKISYEDQVLAVKPIHWFGRLTDVVEFDRMKTRLSNGVLSVFLPKMKRASVN